MGEGKGTRRSPRQIGSNTANLPGHPPGESTARRPSVTRSSWPRSATTRSP